MLLGTQDWRLFASSSFPIKRTTLSMAAWWYSGATGWARFFIYFSRSSILPLECLITFWCCVSLLGSFYWIVLSDFYTFCLLYRPIGNPRLKWFKSTALVYFKASLSWTSNTRSLLSRYTRFLSTPSVSRNLDKDRRISGYNLFLIANEFWLPILISDEFIWTEFSWSKESSCYKSVKLCCDAKPFWEESYRLRTY